MNTPLQKQETSHDYQAEANLAQRIATRPDTPVWVGASAGSGKTRVLVNRLIRLMLPGENTAASDPGQILCITFTKAGASEVSARITKILRGWTISDDATLAAELTDILEGAPTPAQMECARALFACALETPGGMKIKTIHAFCQSVLARFPLEAGLTPGFEAMQENEARALMRDVRRNIIMRLQNDRPDDAKLKTAFDYLSTIRNANDIETLMESLMSERARMRTLLKQHGTIDVLCTAIYTALDTSEALSEEQLITDFCKNIPEADLRTLLPKMAACTTKGNQNAASILADFFVLQNKAALFSDYTKIFITDKATPRKLIGDLKADDFAVSVYAQEAERLIQLDAALRNFSTAQATASLMRFAVCALSAYESEKQTRNRLDFEDLIDRTRILLSGDSVNWVQYKLDGGINHILVDEAQDTNPDQWHIITSLYDEFYTGLSTREDMLRTTFVVGDEKQSIFSFQRADPRVFAQMHTRLQTQTQNAKLPLNTIPLRVSFRSAPSILTMVDEVFAPPHMKDGVLQNAQDTITHHARFTGKAGLVELWPLIQYEEQPKVDDWSLPLKIIHQNDPINQMAEKVAAHIDDLINNPAQILESEGRRIEARDILILLGKRKPLAEALLKALRARNIPSSGIDRMVVTRQLAVRDVLAAIAFVLQPSDDLNLATLLKSPLIGFDDDALFALSYGRQNTSLWQTLKSKGGEAADWLSGLLEMTGSTSAFLHHVLYRPCPCDNHSGLRAILKRMGPDMRDPLQELLARADSYDINEVSGLQGFLQEALADTSEIKRDTNEQSNCVRVMTVHGSKGLEAPIVYMPDTIRTKQARTLKDRIFWPERHDTNGVPLWAQNSESAGDAYQLRKTNAQTRQDEEQRRLLYVALTRAGARLYIGGAQKSKAVDTDNSWYFACEAALKNIGEQIGEDLVLQNRQTDEIKAQSISTHASTQNTTLPQWAFEPAPDAGTPPRPLAPSRPDQDDPSVMSPLFGDISNRFKRGRIIHTLFQFLPDLPKDQRRARATAWLRQPAHGLKASAQDEILKAVFDVLDNPEFEALFTARAHAELPLSGYMNDKNTVVSGQIDRLLVDERGITILDYKTNRPAPKDVNDVPEAYLRQMRTYRDILTKIWPGKPIQCALLWTDGPDLMDISSRL